MSESSAPVYELPIMQEREFVFKLQLNCLSRHSSEMKTLKFSSPPSSVLEIKQTIEDEFSIPTCVQTLCYQSATITDEESMCNAYKHIRSGDTLMVNYSCEADVKRIGEIIEWVKKVMTAILESNDTEDNKHATDLLIHQGARNKYDIILALEIFDWLDAKAFVNKVHVKEIGGLNFILVLYAHILQLEWKDMRSTYKYLESFCSHACANFGETFYFRRVLVKHNILEMATRSINRVKLLIKDKSVFEETNSLAGPDYGSYALKRILENALHIFCNLSELPECQVPIASTSSVIHQALCLSLSDFYHISLSVLVAELFLCLAHSSSAHQYLVQPHVIQTLNLVVFKWLSTSDEHTSRKDHLRFLALRCFTLMVFAQIALVSSSPLPAQFILPITTHMCSFLSIAKPSDIKEYEEDQVCVWATLLPYIKLLFLPPTTTNTLPQRIVSSARSDPNISQTRGNSSCYLDTPTLLASQQIRDGGECPGDQKHQNAPIVSGVVLLSEQHSTISPAHDNTQPSASDEVHRLTRAQPSAEQHSMFSPASPTNDRTLPSPDQLHSSDNVLQTPSKKDIESLQQASLEIILYFLHTKVTRDYHCNVLVEEDLIDFVTCLPWYMTGSSKQKAQDIVAELRTHIRLQPPRLINLARAVLAKMHFGLEKVIKVNSPIELARELS